MKETARWKFPLPSCIGIADGKVWKIGRRIVAGIEDGTFAFHKMCNGLLNIAICNAFGWIIGLWGALGARRNDAHAFMALGVDEQVRELAEQAMALFPQRFPDGAYCFGDGAFPNVPTMQRGYNGPATQQQAGILLWQNGWLKM